MPVYQYKCTKCGMFETYQTMSEDSLSECPSCNQSVVKVFSAPGIVGKGPKEPIQSYNPQRSALWNAAQEQ